MIDNATGGNWDAPSTARQIIEDDHQVCDEVIDDLWSNIGPQEVKQLRPQTRRIAKDLHERLEHHHTGGVVICSRGCCPGCSDCYGESIGCHQDPCVCK
jgi:hypothetical protein